MMFLIGYVLIIIILLISMRCLSSMHLRIRDMPDFRSTRSALIVGTFQKTLYGSVVIVTMLGQQIEEDVRIIIINTLALYD